MQRRAGPGSAMPDLDQVVGAGGHVVDRAEAPGAVVGVDGRRGRSPDEPADVGREHGDTRGHAATGTAGCRPAAPAPPGRRAG